MMTERSLACESTDATGLERTRFFARQLVGPDDLTADQLYHIQKSRRHNRMLHGWGVVCGARVRRGDDPCEVVVEPGYVLGPYGDEIAIGEEITVDLCKEDLDGNAVTGCGEADPWCSEVRVDRRAGDTLYLAVRYVECVTRPVRVLGNGCGCDDTSCEYSRMRDGYAVKVLTSLPSTYSDPMSPPDAEDLLRCPEKDKECAGRPCAPCPAEPWVILADVTLTADGRVDRLDCFSHRRYVVSFADFYFLCRTSSRKIDGIRAIGYEMARLTGAPVLADVTVGVTHDQPLATVPIEHERGWVMMPIHFPVDPGETVASVLEKHGDRVFYHPYMDDTVELSELIGAGGLHPDTRLDGPEDLASRLGAMPLRINDLRVVRSGIDALLDPERLSEPVPPAPADALHLPVGSLRETKGLPAAAARIPFAEVADMSRAAFVERAAHGVAAGRRKAVERLAADVHTRAKRLERLARSLSGGHH